MGNALSYDHGRFRVPEAFATTHWSVVLTAGGGNDAMAHAAMERLCAAYWYPLYAFVRRQGHSPHEAEDLTQEFFARLLERQDLAQVRPERGRFRSFLLASLQHFLANEWHRSQAQKRGGGQIVFSLDSIPNDHRERLEPSDPLNPEILYDRQWATTLFERVMDRMRREYAAVEKSDLFDALKEFLSVKKMTPHAVIARQYKLSVGAVDVAIHRLRKRFCKLLREEVAQTVSGADQVEAEIQHLIAALGG